MVTLRLVKPSVMGCPAIAIPGFALRNYGPPSLRLTFETELAVCKPLEGVTPGQRLHSHLSAHITLIDAVHLRFEQKLVVDVLKAAFAQVHDVSFEPCGVLDFPDVR